MDRYKQLDLDDVAAGMVLSEDVLDAHGGILLPQQTVLTEALLTSLRRCGIDTVQVVNQDISEQDWQAERERLQQRLSRLFRNSRGDGAAAALLQQVTEYRVGEKG